jgi:hypothetical protein
MALKETPPPSRSQNILSHYKHIYLSTKNWYFTASHLSCTPFTASKKKKAQRFISTFYWLRFCMFIWLSKWASRAWNGLKKKIDFCWFQFKSLVEKQKNKSKEWETTNRLTKRPESDVDFKSKLDWLVIQKFLSKSKAERVCWFRKKVI